MDITKIKLQNILFILYKCIISSIVVILGYNYLLKNKFLIDSNKIYNIYMNLDIFNTLRFEFFDSYGNTAKLYNLILFNNKLSYEMFCVVTSILYFLLFIMIIKKVKIINYIPFIILTSFFVFDFIFLFQPSKDFFSLIINLLVFTIFLKNKKNKYCIVSIFIMIYAIFFRIYYVLILIVFFILLILSKVSKKQIISILFILLISFIFIFYNTNYLDEIIFMRVKNLMYLKENTNTLILNVFSYNIGEKNIVIFLMNYCLNFIRIIFPIELFITSPSRGIIFFPLQVYLVYYYIKFVLNINNNNLNQKHINSNIALYVISFFIISVLFEPDFGSVFRHEMNLLPYYIYIIIGTSYKSKKIQIKKI